jgi:hypothetical protein
MRLHSALGTVPMETPSFELTPELLSISGLQSKTHVNCESDVSRRYQRKDSLNAQELQNIPGRL